jgi:hypothetical protein
MRVDVELLSRRIFLAIEVLKGLSSPVGTHRGFLRFSWIFVVFGPFQGSWPCNKGQIKV